MRTLLSPEITRAQFWAFLLFVFPPLTFVFGFTADRWTGIVVVMGAALACAMLLPSVRRRLNLSLFRVVAGLGAGALLYVVTLLGVALIPLVWPGWETSARILYTWREGHSPAFIGGTLVVIVLAEEVFWRGVVARYLMDRHGTALGIVCGAAIYALAHAATFNPLLVIAALGCGIYWGCVYAASDDLVTPTISHLLWDVLLLFVFPVVH